MARTITSRAFIKASDSKLNISSRLRVAKINYVGRVGRQRLLSVFLTAFGGLWLLLEPLAAFDVWDLHGGITGYLVLVGVSAVAALFFARPSSKLTRKLHPSDTEISICVGDLLEQENNVVVGVSDAFDTATDAGVISPQSLQGQLLARIYSQDRSAFDADLETALAGHPSTRDESKTFGKSDRYPLGTAAVVNKGRQRFFLLAYTRMPSTPPAEVECTVGDLELALVELWRAVRASGQNETVHLPIVGSHLARLGLSRTLLVQMIVLSFVAVSARGQVTSSLKIWVRPEDREHVDMAALRPWLKAVCGA